MMDRECNKCVYSTRDGDCRKWSCEGTKTVDDIRIETAKEMNTRIIENIWKSRPLTLEEIVHIVNFETDMVIKEQNK